MPGRDWRNSPDVTTGAITAPEPPVTQTGTRGGMGRGMGRGPMALIVAALIGVALGATLFGGGAGGIAQVSGWASLVFLLPCLLMFGAMMMMGNGSGSDRKR
jgi:hypothetical protein